MENPFFNTDELAERNRIRRNGAAMLPYTLAWFQAVKRPIYCYGAGRYLPTVLQLLASLPISGVIDSNASLTGEKRCGLTVLSTEDFLRQREGSEVVVTAVNSGGPAREIATWCERQGVEWVDWATVALRSDPERWEVDLEIAAMSALDLWADEPSRRLYRHLVRYRASFAPAVFPPAHVNQYFQEIVPRPFYRNFVDVGAYRGDTLDQYRLWMDDSFDAYYALEALPVSLASLREVAGGDPRITVFPVAAGDRPGVARFSSRGGGVDDTCSRLLPTGEIKVRVETLDALLDGRRVGMIKMDIEGAEPEALKGAAGILRDQAPALAISVYHEPYHLWRLPAWILAHHPRCRLYLRHHSDRESETVCYAVPTDGGL